MSITPLDAATRTEDAFDTWPNTLFGRTVPTGLDSFGNLDVWDEAWWPTDLAPQHRDYLAERGVAPFVAWCRGYVSGRGFDELRRLSGMAWDKGLEDHMYSVGIESDGFFLTPLYQWRWTSDVFDLIDTEIAPSTYQIHLDNPRPKRTESGCVKIKDGKPDMRKYECAHKTTRGPEQGQIPGDVNPAAWVLASRRSWSRPRTITLLVTEGAPKGDAALSCALTRDSDTIVPVVWVGVDAPYKAIKDANNRTVERVLADAWDAITDNWPVDADGNGHPARVYICYDSDAKTKKSVRDACTVTGELLAEMDAEVHIVDLPITAALPAGSGIDDVLAHYKEEYSRWSSRYSDLLETLLDLRSVPLADYIAEQDAAKKPSARRATPPTRVYTPSSTSSTGTSTTSVLATPSRASRRTTIG